MTKSILITGCSTGIGYDAAKVLAGRGWKVLATCRHDEDVARLSAEGFLCHRLDYIDPVSIAVAVDWALQQTGGHLDALFNNGAYGMPGAIEDIETDGLREIFETNFFGWHELTRRLIPAMRAQGHGRILQCSSVLGFAALRMRGAYCSTKFAVEGYSDVLRLELQRAGIDVILIEPGPIDTRFRVNQQGPFKRWIRVHGSPWEGFYNRTLMPRLFAEESKPDRWELPVSAVTAKVVHALESPRPRARYFITKPTYIISYLKRLLPTRWLDRVLMKG